jgi:hypothetical protein
LGYEPLPYGDYGVYGVKIGRRKRHIQHKRHRKSYQNGYHEFPEMSFKRTPSLLQEGSIADSKNLFRITFLMAQQEYIL